MRINIIALTIFLSLLMPVSQLFGADEGKVKGEIGIVYSPTVTKNGYGADFHSVLDPVARFAEQDYIKPKFHMFGLGLEASLFVSMYENDHVRLYTSFTYGGKYRRENYAINYPSQLNGNGPAAGDFAGPNAREMMTLDAMTNQFDFGIRIEHTKTKIHGGFTLGVMLYTPLFIRWERFAYNNAGVLQKTAVHTASLSHSTRVDTTPAGSHHLSLRGTSEILASVGGRVGYGPISLGIQYSTNIRVNVVNIDVALRLFSLGGGKN